MQMYLDIIKKMKKYKSSKEIKKIEKDLIETNYYIKNCFFKEKQVKLFIDKIHKEYKDDFKELSNLLNNLEMGGTSTYHLLFNIGYNLFRVAVAKMLDDKSDAEISAIINNTDQVLYYEIMEIVK